MTYRTKSCKVEHFPSKGTGEWAIEIENILGVGEGDDRIHKQIVERTYMTLDTKEEVLKFLEENLG